MTVLFLNFIVKYKTLSLFKEIRIRELHFQHPVGTETKGFYSLSFAFICINSSTLNAIDFTETAQLL